MVFTLSASKTLYLAITFWSPACNFAIVNQEVLACIQSVWGLLFLICINKKNVLFFHNNILLLLIIRKGGRVVDCTNFENWRGLAVTGGSNPSLSEKKMYNRLK